MLFNPDFDRLGLILKVLILILFLPKVFVTEFLSLRFRQVGQAVVVKGRQPTPIESCQVFPQ
jgi:hypothetical protein